MARHNSRMVVVIGLCTLLCLVAAGAAGYFRYANQLPTYPPPQVVMPVPNAYDDYVAAGLLCRDAGGAAVQPPGVGAGWPRRPSFPPGYSTRKQASDPGATLAQMRATVSRNRPALARLRHGFGKQFRSPPVFSYNQLFPELADYRALARVLVVEGNLAEREGRPNGAARSYLDCLRLGIDIPRGGSLIHGLVGLAIQEIGRRSLHGVADRLDGPNAAAAARELARLDRRATPLAETLTNEKAGMTASLLQLFGSSDSRAQIASLFGSTTGSAPTVGQAMMGLRFSLTPKRRIIDNIRGYMDAMIADARRPSSPAIVHPPVPSDPISSVLLPVFSGVKPPWARRDAQWRATEVKLASRAYRLAHGSPPATPAALVPGYLPASFVGAARDPSRGLAPAGR